jgi:hypothetical protein
MSTPHAFRFGVTLLGGVSRPEWIAKVQKAEDSGRGLVVRELAVSVKSSQVLERRVITRREA